MFKFHENHNDESQNMIGENEIEKYIDNDLQCLSHLPISFGIGDRFCRCGKSRSVFTYKLTNFLSSTNVSHSRRHTMTSEDILKMEKNAVFLTKRSLIMNQFLEYSDPIYTKAPNTETQNSKIDDTLPWQSNIIPFSKHKPLKTPGIKNNNNERLQSSKTSYTVGGCVPSSSSSLISDRKFISLLRGFTLYWFLCLNTVLAKSELLRRKNTIVFEGDISYEQATSLLNVVSFANSTITLPFSCGLVELQVSLRLLENVYDFENGVLLNLFRDTLVQENHTQNKVTIFLPFDRRLKNIFSERLVYSLLETLVKMSNRQHFRKQMLRRYYESQGFDELVISPSCPFTPVHMCVSHPNSTKTIQRRGSDVSQEPQPTSAVSKGAVRDQSTSKPAAHFQDAATSISLEMSLVSAQNGSTLACVGCSRSLCCHPLSGPSGLHHSENYFGYSFEFTGANSSTRPSVREQSTSQSTAHSEYAAASIGQEISVGSVRNESTRESDGHFWPLFRRPLSDRFGSDHSENHVGRFSESVRTFSSTSPLSVASDPANLLANQMAPCNMQWEALAHMNEPFPPVPELEEPPESPSPVDEYEYESGDSDFYELAPPAMVFANVYGEPTPHFSAPSHCIPPWSQDPDVGSYPFCSKTVNGIISPVNIPKQLPESSTSLHSDAPLPVSPWIPLGKMVYQTSIIHSVGEHANAAIHNATDMQDQITSHDRNPPTDLSSYHSCLRIRNETVTFGTEREELLKLPTSANETKPLSSDTYKSLLQPVVYKNVDHTLPPQSAAPFKGTAFNVTTGLGRVGSQLMTYNHNLASDSDFCLHTEAASNTPEHPSSDYRMPPPLFEIFTPPLTPPAEDQTVGMSNGNSEVYVVTRDLSRNVIVDPSHPNVPATDVRINLEDNCIRPSNEDGEDNGDAKEVDARSSEADESELVELIPEDNDDKLKNLKPVENRFFLPLGILNVSHHEYPPYNMWRSPWFDTVGLLRTNQNQSQSDERNGSSPANYPQYQMWNMPVVSIVNQYPTTRRTSQPIAAPLASQQQLQPPTPPPEESNVCLNAEDCVSLSTYSLWSLPKLVDVKQLSNTDCCLFFDGCGATSTPMPTHTGDDGDIGVDVAAVTAGTIRFPPFIPIIVGRVSFTDDGAFEYYKRPTDVNGSAAKEECELQAPLSPPPGMLSTVIAQRWFVFPKKDSDSISEEKVIIEDENEEEELDEVDEEVCILTDKGKSALDSPYVFRPFAPAFKVARDTLPLMLRSLSGLEYFQNGRKLLAFEHELDCKSSDPYLFQPKFAVSLNNKACQTEPEMLLPSTPVAAYCVEVSNTSQMVQSPAAYSYRTSNSSMQTTSQFWSHYQLATTPRQPPPVHQFWLPLPAMPSTHPWLGLQATGSSSQQAPVTAASVSQFWSASHFGQQPAAAQGWAAGQPLYYGLGDVFNRLGQPGYANVGEYSDIPASMSFSSF